MLQTTQKAKEVVSNMIIISGVARSGTTILGKILHTSEQVEYSFEPPVLSPLFANIDQMEGSLWKLIFETYCFEELLAGNLTGRSFNFNVNDDSNILKVKPKSLVKERLKGNHRRILLESKVGNQRLCIKMPNKLTYLLKYQVYYPDSTLIIVIRKANDVLNSSLKRHWFDDLDMISPNVIVPFYVYKNFKIPYWVKVQDRQWWLDVSRKERAAYTYLINMEIIEKIKNKIIIDYHQLIIFPKKVVSDLFGKLNINPTPQTTKLLKEVKPIDSENEDILSNLPRSLLKRIKKVENRYFF